MDANGSSSSEKIKFYGIDRFNRPVFKSLDKPKRFFGSVHDLFNYEATESEVLNQVTEEDLCFFGEKFECEPWGTETGDITIVRDAVKNDATNAKLHIDQNSCTIDDVEVVEKGVCVVWDVDHSGDATNYIETDSTEGHYAYYHCRECGNNWSIHQRQTREEAWASVKVHLNG